MTNIFTNMIKSNRSIKILIMHQIKIIEIDKGYCDINSIDFEKLLPHNIT